LIKTLLTESYLVHEYMLIKRT